MNERHLSATIGIDAEELPRHRSPRQQNASLIEDVDPVEKDGVSAVFDRNSNSFLKIYLAVPEGLDAWGKPAGH